MNSCPHENWFSYCWRQLSSPWRVLTILRYWQSAPFCVVVRARDFGRPVAHVAFGHTHRAGTWRRDGIAIYNTGSLMPFSQPYAIVVEGARVEWRPLEELLAALPAAPCS